MKKLLSLALALALCLGLAIPAGAIDAGAPGTAVICTNGSVSAAIKSDGSLWMWGKNDNYQLGNGGGGNDNYGPDDRSHSIQTVPLKIMDNVASVSINEYHTAAVKTDGSLWTWGWGVNGMLGDGKTDFNHYATTPQKVMDGVVAVACGSEHTAVLKADGSLWTWGGNGFGQVGKGDFGTDYQTTPLKVMDNVAAVKCSNYSTLAIKTDGSLWGCGKVIGGALDGEFIRQGTPIKIMDDVVDAVVDTNAYVVKSDGSLWVWGQNQFGYLGLGNLDPVSEPVKLMDDVVAVDGDGSNVGVLKSDGSLWMWGNNNNCQLGFKGGDYQYSYRDYQTTPVKVLDDVAAFSASFCAGAVKSDGSLWMWGANLRGSIGNGKWGNNNAVATPVQVLTGVAVPAKPSPTVAGFSDVHESDYYADAVVWAKDSGVTGGTTATTFSPSATVTRAQAMTFLWRAAGSPQPSSTVSPFSDVSDPSAYYYNAVLWAAEQGITTGVTATTFGTGSPVAYDQMLAFLARASGADTSGGSWSQAAIDWAANNGLTDGLTFSAKDACPRSDVIYCLWKQLA